MKNLLIAAALCAPIGAVADEKQQLIVYTYDSFVTDWGPGPQIEAAFEATCACDLQFVAAGDGAALLARVQLEGAHSDADIVLGLDANLIPKATDTGLFEVHIGEGATLNLPRAWRDDTFIPYDWGYFAFIYDNTLLETPPASFAALIDSDLKIIIQDPRSSSPGLGLLLWVKAAFGDGSADIWAGLEPHIVTVTAGWSEAYGMFLEGEADMVLSYSTSPAYHRIAEEDLTKSAAVFSDGHAVQIEVAAKLAASDQPELADAFLDFLIGETAQAIIPTTNWMYPAAAGDLPDGFDSGFLAAVQTLPALEQPEAARIAATAEWLEVLGR